MTDVKTDTSGLNQGRVAAGAGPVVLVVDDHTDTRSMLSRLLRKEGFEIATAGSVAEAIAVAEGRSLDALVSDISLPDGLGYEVVARVRAIQGQVPAIALSGYGMESDVCESRQAGFDVHLTKPVVLDRLIETLKRVTAPSN